MFHVRYAMPNQRFEMAGCCDPGPKVDIAEIENEYTLSLEIPGIYKQDVKIWLDGDNLIVSGEKKAQAAPESKILVSERSFGKFERAFILPGHVDRNKISAQFIDGLLVISIPKSIEAKPREISIS